MGVSVSILRRTPIVQVFGKTIQTNSLRSEAMLIYLCMSAEVTHTRESIACLLWEDAAPKQSMSSLRQLIRKIRLADPALEEFINFGRNQIIVDLKAISLDLDTLITSLETNDPAVLTRTFDFGIEEILTKFVGISGYLDSWVTVVRNRVESSLRNSLGKALNRSDWDAEYRDFAARTLIHFDPTNESACGHLMQRYAEAGNQAAAIQLYNSLYQTLGDIHDTEPNEEIQNLNAQIKLGQIHKHTATVSPAAKSSLDDLPSIFVAMFDQNGTDRHLRNFTQVLRQELITNLSTFRAWRLFDSEPTVTEGFRLEGLTGQDGNDLHFIATLKMADSNRIVWSERFRMNHKNWGVVQRQVARRLSLAVNAGLSHDSLNQRPISNPGNASLFDRWIHARAQLLEWNPHKLQIATELLDEVLEDVPNFAPAHSLRSNIEIMRQLITPGVLSTKESLSLGLDHAKRALSADPLDPRAHIAMGWALAMTDQHNQSLFHFETCRELNPFITVSSLSCALGFAFAGDTVKASDIADESLSLVRDVPPYLWGYVQNIRFLHDDLDGAIQAGKRASDSIANLPAWHVAALWESGDQDQAIQVAKEFAKISQTQWGANTSFSHQALVDWFVSCFPLRVPQQVQRLRSSLEAALSEVVKRDQMLIAPP